MPFLTGHGPLGHYLERFKLTNSNICLNCNLQKAEDVLHLLFECPKFNESRSKYLTKNNINSQIDLKNILNSDKLTCDFKRFCEYIIKNKKTIK